MNWETKVVTTRTELPVGALGGTAEIRRREYGDTSDLVPVAPVAGFDLWGRANSDNGARLALGDDGRWGDPEPRELFAGPAEPPVGVLGSLTLLWFGLYAASAWGTGRAFRWLTDTQTTVVWAAAAAVAVAAVAAGRADREIRIRRWLAKHRLTARDTLCTTSGSWDRPDNQFGEGVYAVASFAVTHRPDDDPTHELACFAAAAGIPAGDTRTVDVNPVDYFRCTHLVPFSRRDAVEWAAVLAGTAVLAALSTIWLQLGIILLLPFAVIVCALRLPDMLGMGLGVLVGTWLIAAVFAFA